MESFHSGLICLLSGDINTHRNEMFKTDLFVISIILETKLDAGSLNCHSDGNWCVASIQ